MDASETVDDLKKITVEKPNTIRCDADDLKLYLAKTPGGIWLDCNDAKNEVLDQHGQLNHDQEMNALDYINENFSVSTQVPRGGLGPAPGKRYIEVMGDIVRASVSKDFMAHDEKQSTCPLSVVTSVMKRRLLKKMALKVTLPLGMNEPHDESILVFEWNDELLENQ
ncbi:hypothetical protein AC1031_008994 [Aphanomyces cochlioides]|nr:hypothetical protein AC1031_008994 [Aphanomyces cochlioides]